MAPGDVRTLEEASERWRLERGDAVLLEKDAKGTVVRCRADGSYIIKRADGTSRFRPRHGVVFTSETLLAAEDRLLARAEDMTAPELDLDVIDVSWMDMNVHSMRHNFFNVNRWMVDDLREIITTQARARLRTSRMTHRFGNVWSFLAAPRHIVNE